VTEATAVNEKVYSIDINAPIAKVWAEITKTNTVSRPMFDCVMKSDLKPGSPYRHYTKDNKRVMVHGRVQEVEPPAPGGKTARFVQTFRFTTIPDEVPSLVVWELNEVRPGVTKVTVVHSNLSDKPKTAKQIDGGWPTILENYKSVLETGNVPLKCRIMYAMFGVMGFMLPKSTLAQNVKD